MLIDKKVNKNRKKTKKKTSVKISTDIIFMFIKCKFKICSIKIKKNKKYLC